MTVDEVAPSRPLIASVAYYVMLVLGILFLALVPWNPGGLVDGVLFLIAALGIRRLHAWSAYGLALLMLVMSGGPIAGQMFGGNVAVALLIVAGGFTLVILVLLFFAGRALEQKYGRRGRAWPWALASVAAGTVLLLFRLYQMPTGSMEKTLLPGDCLAVWKTHGREPVRGEVVVHIYPMNRKDTFVKRVVAIPGDRVRIHDKQLFINGSAVREPYAEHVTPYVDSYRDNFPSSPTMPLYPAATEMLAKNVVNGEVVVPPGRYFVLGDNRDSSLDSRYWGFIQASDIIGTPKMIYYSVDPGDAVARKVPILNVRWGRMFHMVG